MERIKKLLITIFKQQTNVIITVLFVFLSGITFAQKKGVTAVSASVNAGQGVYLLDDNGATAWTLGADELRSEQFLMFTLQTPGDVREIQLEAKGISKEDIQKSISVFITYDPMNPGDAVKYDVRGSQKFSLTFPPKYGAHVRLVFSGNTLKKPVSVAEVAFVYTENRAQAANPAVDRPWLNAALPVKERVETLLAAMTPNDKMELIREGWGIPGIPHLGVPDMKKVEAVHGFSYGSGATVFPQAIAMGATWNRTLVERVGEIVGDETAAAGAIQAWSPVLDVAQDPRWGRCEETFGEDPVLVSLTGGAWIKGFQSKGLITTPKHFAIHGAPLGGRDSHDMGLSEREIREIHLAPFRHVIREYDCQSLMMAYSDYLGVPVAKSRELLHGILREEWGFSGFIVSDCGAVGNLTARKHYTATDFVEAANQALAAGIATNCGDTYNNKDVIAAANSGGIDMENLDNVCRTMLNVMFRKGLFENNLSKALDWNSTYPGWQSAEHRALAREAARESVVLLENRGGILPLSKSLKTIAVIGPGADDLQPGDYSPKLQEGQLKSVLTGIKEAVDKSTKVIYEQGCEFNGDESFNPENARKAALQSDVVVMVLGDYSNSAGRKGVRQTSGENHDYATLELPGYQQKLLEAVCETGKPVILVLQAGRPYNISYAAERCRAILVNWLPGQEGGPATADVLFGDCNPAGRLPMTFPRHVGQVPNYYNFKTSGRRYEYSDMEFYPLYPFGYGLSYTQFRYSNLQTQVNADGTVSVQADVKNAGERRGDEVVQLYVTDMYASVKTRVMELKDFERITLEPGASKTVKFTLTPYQLSLLNDQMDRVVEPGEFKIAVGGSSPSYKAQDRIKESVGFADATKGVAGSIDYPHAFAADFSVSHSGTEEILTGGSRRIILKVKNSGNLMDAGKICLFADGVRSEEIHHYELASGEEKTVTFDLNKNAHVRQLIFATKYKSISINL
ncbi:MAG: glycoside hydrolase family 3 C-terminal domain-containing protein [Tannerella sp.]|jgi:beta-glucosidase|nr:glycoside hydrolase family 3 C-terminal domain-containing protein [Tannerella sp.]